MKDELSILTLGAAKAAGGGGGGGTSNYNALENKPQINGNTLSGNKTGANLGLVDAVSGKGLSSNDYTNADKAIVDGVTSALAGKADNATTLAGYGITDAYTKSAVDTALALKADKNELPTKTSDLTNDSGFITQDTNTQRPVLIKGRVMLSDTDLGKWVDLQEGDNITLDAHTSELGVVVDINSTNNTKLKTRYSISYSSWSSSPNSDGYYTYSLTLSPTLDTTVSPDVLIAGSSNTSQPTDTHKTMFSYVERCYLSGSSLTLYAKTKPTSTFYIWVEGVAGSGSGNIVGNVIQPNGAVSGGINTTRFFRLQCTKSDMEARGDGKGYTVNLGGAALTQAQRNALDNANLLMSNCYGNMPGVGLGLMNSSIGKPDNLYWFFSMYNTIAPERWFQMMRLSGSQSPWVNYAIISTAAYEQLTSTDIVIAWDMYILS